MRQSLTGRTVLALLAVLMLALPGHSAIAGEETSCLAEIAKAEHYYRIPAGLLVAIGLAESGRRDPASGIVAPWPWTIDSHGQGRFFDSRDQAVAETARLLTGNDSLVDVGCMQVDLYHHPHAFGTLLAAFDPETNVDYAARYLVGLRRQHGSWLAAAAAYHAGDPASGNQYAARVLYYWRDLGTTPDKALPLPGQPRNRGFVIDTDHQPLDIAADFYRKKDYGAALVLYRSTLAARPDDATALLGAALCLRQTHDEENARFYLEKVLTVAPDNLEAKAELLRLIDAGPASRKTMRLHAMRMVVGDDPQVTVRLAMSEAADGRLEDAAVHMREAQRQAPEDAVIALDYALLLDRTGDRRAALTAYDRFLQLYRPGAVVLDQPLESIRNRRSYLWENLNR